MSIKFRKDLFSKLRNYMTAFAEYIGLYIRICAYKHTHT